MLSPTHTAIVDLLGAHPDALAYLLQLQGHAPPARLRLTSGTWSKVIRLERRVDRAFVEGPRKAPTGFVLVEVQLGLDDDKRYSWSLYLELARSRYRCEGALVVVTVAEDVRRWVRAAVEPATGLHGTRRKLTPTVIALDEIDPALLLDPARPHLAMLAVAGHAKAADAEEVAERAVRVTLDELPKPLAVAQLDAILGIVDVAIRATLEKQIMQRREFQSDFFRRPFEQGKTEGKTEGKAEAILAVLEARKIPVSDAIRAQILACADVEVLDLWIRRAALATTAASVVRVRAPKAKATRAKAAGA